MSGVSKLPHFQLPHFQLKNSQHLIWIGIKGLSLSEEEKKYIPLLGISGVVLFKRNIHSLLQLWELCREIHSLNPSPFIAIDQEGGPVDRLKHLSDYTPWPAPEDLCQTHSEEKIEQIGFTSAEELKTLGVSVNFAPVLDVPSVKSDLLKKRCFGKTPAEVSQNGLAWLKGLQRAGLMGCVKHFPGHGGTTEDSHFHLPVDERSLKELKEKDLIPFQKAISFGAEMVMTGHLLFPKVDPVHPVTLSSVFLKKILREEMGFKGWVISDDLDMKALYTKGANLQEVMGMALKAGVDILLKCRPEEGFFELLQEFSSSVKPSENLALRWNNFYKKHKPIEPAPSFDQVKKRIEKSNKLKAEL